MKQVVALETGFYAGARVRAGTQFEVPDDFKAAWVAAVSSPAAVAQAAKKPARSEPKALSEIAKAPVKSAADIV